MYFSLLRFTFLTLVLAFGVLSVPLSAADRVDTVRFSFPPGTYNQDVLLSAETGPGYSLLYRFQGNDERLRDLPFTQTLQLSAARGETRQYQVTVKILKEGKQVEERILDYVIDKTTPFSPEALTPPFTATQSLTVEFGLSPRDRNARVFIRYRGTDGSSGVSGGEPRIVLEGKKGQSVAYELAVYAEDDAHNQSPTRIWNYTVDRRKEIDLDDIPVLSPVEGIFQNPQFLYIDSQSFSDIRYTTDGSDPKTGQPYTGGTLLNSSGKVLLRIWGKTRTGKEIQKSISYEAGVDRLDGIESGILDGTKVIQQTSEIFYYAAGEKTPSIYDPTIQNPLRIAPQTGALRGLALRLMRDRDHAVFRYYFVLDGRSAPSPELSLRTKNALWGGTVAVVSGTTVSDDVIVSGQAADGARIWYRLDGKQPDSGNDHNIDCSGTQTISFADLKKNSDQKGMCTIVAQSRSGPNTWSPAVIVPLSIATETAVAPQVKKTQNPDGTVLLSASSDAGEIWYRVGSVFHGPEKAGPFKMEVPAILSVPLGAAAHFHYDFFSVKPGAIVSSQTTGIDCDLVSLPPVEPTIQRGKDGLVQIVAPGTLVYRVLADNKDAPSITSGFIPYAQSITLKPVQGENVLYTVEAYEKDAAGNASPISRETFPVHTRPPHGVRLVGGESEVYRNTLQSSVQIESPEAGVEYHYSLGLPATVSDPTPQSPWVSSDIPVVTTEKRSRLELRIQGISSYNRALVGPVSRFYVSVDTSTPGIPKVSGVEDGKSYRTPLSIQISSEPGILVQYLLRAPDQTTENHYLDYTQAINVEAPADTQRDWELLVKARNKAGSEIALPHSIRFRIDTRTPALPVFMTSSDSGASVPAFGQNLSIVSKNDVEIRLNTSAELNVYYEISQDLSRMTNPDRRSSRYSDPLRFSVENGQEKTWYLRYCAYDSAGNQSPVSGLHTIVVDKKIPAIPAEPKINRQGNKGDLVWASDPSVGIEYAMLSATAGADLHYTLLSGKSLSWEIPEGQDSIAVYYRARDLASNTSESAFVTILRKKVAPQPGLNGVNAGGLYRDPIDIRPAGLLSGAQLRYELSTGADKPQDVSATSQQIGDFLEVGPISGETVQYHLVVRQFADGYEPSEPLLVDFTIDRTPPQPPQITEIQGNSAWFADSTNLNFSADPKTTVWFSVISEKMDYKADQSVVSNEQLAARFLDAHYAISQGQIDLPAPKDSAPVRYLISAYAVDAAGNHSLQTAYWQIFVDPLTVYVAEQGISSGAVPEQGSRSQPFHDLGNAVDFARSKGKKHIVIASGKYPLAHSLAVPDIFIEGGRDSSSWAPSDSSQTIVYPAPSFSDKVLFTVDSGHFYLQSVYLTDAGKALSTLISQKGAETSIIRSNLAISQSQSAVQSGNSKLSLDNSTVSSNDSLNVSLLDISETECSIRACVVESSDLPIVLQKNAARAVQLMINSRQSNLTVQQSSITPRRGLSTAALRIEGGNLSLLSSTVSTGSGTQSALGIDALTGAQVVIDDCRIVGEAGAQTAILIRMNTTMLQIKGSFLKLDAGIGVYGIYAQQGSLQMVNDEMQGGQARDFITMISADQVALDVNSSRFKGAETTDFHIANVRGGSSVWKGNSTGITGVQTGQGSGLFSFSSAGLHRFEDNNLIGNDLCTLFYAASPETQFTIRNNILERWQFILQESTPHPIRQSEMDQGISTIQDLEQLTRQGSLFEGNKVRQGL